MKMFYLVLLAGAVLVWSQNPSIVSGSAQTPVFALTAGATTGAENGLLLASRPLAFKAFYANAIHYRISGLSATESARLSLYDLNGRLLNRVITQGQQGLFALNKPLPNGIYFLRMECMGKNIRQTAKLAVVR